jgi:hypothetical protein
MLLDILLTGGVFTTRVQHEEKAIELLHFLHIRLLIGLILEALRGGVETHTWHLLSAHMRLLQVGSKRSLRRRVTCTQHSHCREV